MLSYTKREFQAGPKDGDKRVADPTKVHYFASSDPGWCHAYSYVPNQWMFVYLGYVERSGMMKVEPLSVGVER